MIPTWGAKPVVDHSVTLPFTTIDVAQECTTQVCLAELTDLADTDSGSSDDEIAAKDDSAVLTVQMVQERSSDCIFLLNSASMLAHVAACCEPSDASCVVTVQDGEMQKSFKFACIVRRSALDGQVVPAETFPSQYKVCMRPACAKIFD